MSELPEKRRPHFIKVLSETWKETELRDVIIMDLVGTAMTLFLALIFHVLEWDEIKELIFLALVGGVCGVIASFTYRFFFVTPGKLYGKLEEKLEIAEAKISEREIVKPLEIEASSLGQRWVAENELSADCVFEIKNPNQPVSGIRFTFVKIEPPMRGFYSNKPHNSAFPPGPVIVGAYSTDICDLSSLPFSFKDVHNNSLNKGDSGHISIFTATRTTLGITLSFKGDWNSTWPNSFSVNKEYIITVKSSATGVEAHPAQFKLLFSLDPKQPIFILEKIDPPQPANSLGKCAIGSPDKAKKRSDPASVVILICLSASLVVVAAAQRFQIQKLQNPPAPKITVRKLIPDKIIPQPAISNAPSIIPSPQVTNAESPIQFQTSNPSADSGDSEAEMAKIKAKKTAEIAAKKEADRKEAQSYCDSRWKGMLPIYKDCIETFYDILKKEADRHNEGIAKTVNYFNCLPDTINYELGKTNVAEIKFQTQTNMDFHIAISCGDINYQRGLRISSSCGYFDIHHHPIYPYNLYVIGIHIRGFDDEKNVPPEQAHSLTEEDLRLLKDGQVTYSSETNHTK